jgi:hypothetical protein
MDAKEYDPRPAQRMRRLIGAAAVLVVAALVFWWFFRYWPQERVVNQFFSALERKDFDAAYGIYNADPDWKQQAAKYDQYPLSQFVRDWGPSSDYGAIVSHKIACAKGTGSGVIVAVNVNGHDCPVAATAGNASGHTAECSQTAFTWVENKTRTLTLSPLPLKCGILR